jgi:valyl-tRNA synthetase
MMRVAIPSALSAQSGLVETLATLARAEITTYDDDASDTVREQIAAVRAVADRAKLLARYEREIARLIPDLERAEKKLTNRGFVEKAARDVVAEARAKAAGLRDELERIRRALDELA